MMDDYARSFLGLEDDLETASHEKANKLAIEGDAGNGSNDSVSPAAKDMICAICLCDMNGELGTPASCDHTFCLFCIVEWSKHNCKCPRDGVPFRSVFVQSALHGPIESKLSVAISKKESARLAEENSSGTSCKVCRRSDHEEQLLLCDGCDNGFHLECMDPPLKSPPFKEWRCGSCCGLAGPISCKWKRVEGDGSKLNVPEVPRLIPRTRLTERLRLLICQKKKNTQKECSNHSEKNGENMQAKKLSNLHSNIYSENTSVERAGHRELKKEGSDNEEKMTERGRERSSSVTSGEEERSSHRKGKKSKGHRKDREKDDSESKRAKKRKKEKRRASRKRKRSRSREASSGHSRSRESSTEKIAAHGDNVIKESKNVSKLSEISPPKREKSPMPGSQLKSPALPRFVMHRSFRRSVSHDRGRYRSRSNDRHRVGRSRSKGRHGNDLKRISREFKEGNSRSKGKEERSCSRGRERRSRSRGKGQRSRSRGRERRSRSKGREYRSESRGKRGYQSKSKGKEHRSRSKGKEHRSRSKGKERHHSSSRGNDHQFRGKNHNLDEHSMSQENENDTNEQKQSKSGEKHKKRSLQRSQSRERVSSKHRHTSSERIDMSENTGGFRSDEDVASPAKKSRQPVVTSRSKSPENGPAIIAHQNVGIYSPSLQVSTPVGSSSPSNSAGVSPTPTQCRDESPMVDVGNIMLPSVCRMENLIENSQYSLTDNMSNKRLTSGGSATAVTHGESLSGLSPVSAENSPMSVGNFKPLKSVSDHRRSRSSSFSDSDHPARIRRSPERTKRCYDGNRRRERSHDHSRPRHVSGDEYINGNRSDRGKRVGDEIRYPSRDIEKGNRPFHNSFDKDNVKRPFHDVFVDEKLKTFGDEHMAGNNDNDRAKRLFDDVMSSFFKKSSSPLKLQERIPEINISVPPPSMVPPPEQFRRQPPPMLPVPAPSPAVGQFDPNFFRSRPPPPLPSHQPPFPIGPPGRFARPPPLPEHPRNFHVHGNFSPEGRGHHGQGGREGQSEMVISVVQSSHSNSLFYDNPNRKSFDDDYTSSPELDFSEYQSKPENLANLRMVNILPELPESPRKQDMRRSFSDDHEEKHNLGPSSQKKQMLLPKNMQTPPKDVMIPKPTSFLDSKIEEIRDSASKNKLNPLFAALFGNLQEDDDSDGNLIRDVYESDDRKFVGGSDSETSPKSGSAKGEKPLMPKASPEIVKKLQFGWKTGSETIHSRGDFKVPPLELLAAQLGQHSGLDKRELAEALPTKAHPRKALQHLPRVGREMEKETSRVASPLTLPASGAHSPFSSDSSNSDDDDDVYKISAKISKESAVASALRHEVSHAGSRSKPASSSSLLAKLPLPPLSPKSRHVGSKRVLDDEERKAKKVVLEGKIVEQVKKLLDPHYKEKVITREEYKEIVAKCVQKVLPSEFGEEVEKKKIQSLVDGYIKLYKHNKRKLKLQSIQKIK